VIARSDEAAPSPDEAAPNEATPPTAPPGSTPNEDRPNSPSEAATPNDVMPNGAASTHGFALVEGSVGVALRANDAVCPEDRTRRLEPLLRSLVRR
jgi:hypothetical protein